ncbi:MAG TPA: hypothetical protein PKL29_06085, partial [Methanothrix sp.]|nr:hypothetical protein [Methanothrix sp.]
TGAFRRNFNGGGDIRIKKSLMMEIEHLSPPLRCKLLFSSNILFNFFIIKINKKMAAQSTG